MIDQAATVVSNPDLSAQLHTLNAYMEQLASFVSHGVLGGASAHAIEWLKGKPGLSKAWALLSPRGKVAATAIVAALGSLGISFTFQHGDADGVYLLTFSGLTWTSIGQHLWSFVQSYVAQQGYFATVIKPKEVTGVPPKPNAPEPVPVVVEGAKQ